MGSTNSRTAEDGGGLAYLDIVVANYAALVAIPIHRDLYAYIPRATKVIASLCTEYDNIIPADAWLNLYTAHLSCRLLRIADTYKKQKGKE